MFFLPITVAVLANVFYHVASKSIPAEQNAFMGPVVNYATALIASAILFCLTPHENILIAPAMLAVGGFFYYEQISAQKIIGAAFCVAGVILLSLP